MINTNYWYDKWKIDSISNACVLRITNQCNERCEHCAFRSGPECVGQMSVETCKKINAWVPYKVVLNIMGGEFTILDNYPEMLMELVRNRNTIRLVTNGFWSHNDKSVNKFFLATRQIKDVCQNIDIAVQNDRWHKQPGSKIIKLLRENAKSLKITVIDGGVLEANDVAPIGRAWDNKILPAGYTSRCCEGMCNMTITEDGMICKCPYGYFPWKHFGETTWHDTQEYVWRWRAEKLAEGMDCRACMETIDVTRRKELSLINS